jgi:hypothetical protein
VAKLIGKGFWLELTTIKLWDKLGQIFTREAIANLIGDRGGLPIAIAARPHDSSQKPYPEGFFF